MNGRIENKNTNEQRVKVSGLFSLPDSTTCIATSFDCVVTSEITGKTLSLVTPHGIYHIPFIQLRDYLK